MTDIINLLPDSLANQIAAGEVVQRPASVVKELLENSIDAGASSITLSVSDGGKAGIEVVDNGKGMSATDARLCFERHATSKIAAPEDLEAITTMGFRGEALASIAAVAEVTLTTRREEDEVGVQITLAGSQVVSQTPTPCAKGAHFSVRNLFFNVPARRRFLKGTSVEMKHVVAEFQRVAIANPSVAMTLIHDSTTMYALASANRYKRIADMFGPRLENALIPMAVSTETLAIEGYIGKPNSARQRGGEQFLFVNGRFMRSAYFNRAIVDAYGKLIAPGTNPVFFLHFAVPPESIDVNIHPTKTEVKFEDERHIWQILHAGIRESLGKYGGLPLIDFERDATINSYYPNSAPILPQEFGIDTAYNPLERQAARRPSRTGNTTPEDSEHCDKGESFDCFDSYPVEEVFEVSASLYQDESHVAKKLQMELNDTHSIQFRNAYIITPIRSGLAFIDQHRAHARILYEQLMNTNLTPIQSQHLLFPAKVSITADEALLAEDLIRDVATAGILIQQESPNTLTLLAYPSHIEVKDPELFIHDLLAHMAQEQQHIGNAAYKHHLAAIAFASAVPKGQPLGAEARMDLISRLFSCQEPAVDPHMRPLIYLLSDKEVTSFFS